MQRQRYRDTAQGRRQAAALQRAEQDSGRKRSAIVAELPVEYDQYKRYVRGDTPLKWDQIPLFAAAYQIPPAALTAALGLMEPEANAPWSMYDALLRGGVPLADIPDYVAEYGDADLEDQQAAVTDILLMYAEIRAEAQERMLARQHCRTRPA